MSELRAPRPRQPRTVNESRRLRNDATRAEVRFWRAIRGNVLGHRFRRQHPIGDFIVDFACVELRTVIEIDGGQHSLERDASRDAWLTDNGRRVIRYWNNEVIDNLDGVLGDLTNRLGR